MVILVFACNSFTAFFPVLHHKTWFDLLLNTDCALCHVMSCHTFLALNMVNSTHFFSLGTQNWAQSCDTVTLINIAGSVVTLADNVEILHQYIVHHISTSARDLPVSFYNCTQRKRKLIFMPNAPYIGWEMCSHIGTWHNTQTCTTRH